MPRSALALQKDRQITGLQLCAQPKFWQCQEPFAHGFRSPGGITELEEPTVAAPSARSIRFTTDRFEISYPSSDLAEPSTRFARKDRYRSTPDGPISAQSSNESLATMSTTPVERRLPSASLRGLPGSVPDASMSLARRPYWRVQSRVTGHIPSLITAHI